MSCWKPSPCWLRVFHSDGSKFSERIYAAASLFCIPSTVEGFPLTVVEAITNGLAVVGFAGCSGVNSLVAHGRTDLGRRDEVAIPGRGRRNGRTTLCSRTDS
ncbi:MAG: glycosyltransferase [Desulfovibrio sp.]|nr:glycosyltransferase [Desulfovibrio sp.]